MFQNHCFHFSFLCSDIAHNKATQETNITLIEEDEEDLLKEYLPDETIMNVLSKCLLDSPSKKVFQTHMSPEQLCASIFPRLKCGDVGVWKGSKQTFLDCSIFM